MKYLIRSEIKGNEPYIFVNEFSKKSKRFDLIAYFHNEALFFKEGAFFKSE